MARVRRRNVFRDSNRHFAYWTEAIAGVTIDLECRVIEKYPEGIRFHVYNRDHAINLSNPDPNKLREKLREELEQKLTLGWSYFLAVTTTEEHDSGSPPQCWETKRFRPFMAEAEDYHNAEASIGLKLEVGVWRSGTVASSKKRLWEQLSGGSWTREKRPPTEKGDRYGDNDPNDEDKAIALVPLTPETMAALAGIVQGIDTLRAQLMELLRPATIEATLEAVRTAGLPMLGLEPAENTAGTPEGV